MNSKEDMEVAREMEEEEVQDHLELEMKVAIFVTSFSKSD